MNSNLKLQSTPLAMYGVLIKSAIGSINPKINDAIFSIFISPLLYFIKQKIAVNISNGNRRRHLFIRNFLIFLDLEIAWGIIYPDIKKNIITPDPPPIKIGKFFITSGLAR